jgi:tetratricopeptide (TPR) repeat protein
MPAKFKIILNILPFLLSFYLCTSAVAKNVESKEMELEAKKAYSSGKYQLALSIWSNLLQQSDLKTVEKANIYTNLGALYQQLGKSGLAVSNWLSAIALSRHGQDKQSRHLLAGALVDKAQAHNTLGQTDFSIPLLQEGINIASQENFRLIIAFGYQALGNAALVSA